MQMSFVSNIPASVNGLEVLKSFNDLVSTIMTKKDFSENLDEMLGKLKELQDVQADIDAKVKANQDILNGIKAETAQNQRAEAEARLAIDSAKKATEYGKKLKDDLEQQREQFSIDRTELNKEISQFQISKASQEKEAEKKIADIDFQLQAAKEAREKGEAFKSEHEAKLRAFQNIAKTPQA